mmetsp:Transcript_150357/g.287956  ORF Transcript_150357/g.287956 Transcript_150357/m.287956 type:complete len:368 (-) Transcript_150357:2611-3714(-)
MQNQLPRNLPTCEMLKYQSSPPNAAKSKLSTPSETSHLALQGLLRMPLHPRGSRPVRHNLLIGFATAILRGPLSTSRAVTAPTGMWRCAWSLLVTLRGVIGLRGCARSNADRVLTAAVVVRSTRWSTLRTTSWWSVMLSVTTITSVAMITMVALVTLVTLVTLIALVTLVALVALATGRWPSGFGPGSTSNKDVLQNVLCVHSSLIFVPADEQLVGGAGVALEEAESACLLFHITQSGSLGQTFHLVWNLHHRDITTSSDVYGHRAATLLHQPVQILARSCAFTDLAGHVSNVANVLQDTTTGTRKLLASVAVLSECERKILVSERQCVNAPFCWAVEVPHALREELRHLCFHCTHHLQLCSSPAAL